ncbi:FAD-dependent oxidoreductase [Amycolatopsis taiwanensis]|uniref:FAD-dependent oxidoreductase n=1 Tax=Amycolatopsis taiwanensis TaxID=342230 RepID=UPI0004B4E5C7|nr:NAD(P)/FAD-dependent oxidoreductase [Amycolatopsis taiwanensis]
MKILIVGAGLSGPLLAHGLRRAGIDVVLYEREAAPDERSQGYRIHLEPEGDLALRACLPDDRYERVVATSGKLGSGVTVLDPQLRVVHRVVVPPRVEGTDGQHLTVDRLTLRRNLLADLDVRFGAPFERYELLDNGRVRACFANGETAEADLLVAADGTHSRIRTQLLPEAEVVETGQSLIFGKTVLTPQARELAPAAALDGFSAVAGDDGRFMPLAAHEYRTPCGDEDYLMWVVGSPSTMLPVELSTLDKLALQKVAAELIADWPAELGALVRLTDPATVHATTVRSAKPLSHWETVPVTLIGDAIHTMVPAGIGAAVALRDAALLSRRITERNGSLLPAVHDYETEMLDYGFAAVERSSQGAL